MAKRWQNKKTGIWYIRYKDNHGNWQLKHVGKNKKSREVEEIRKKYDSLEMNRAYGINTPIKGIGIADILNEFTQNVLCDPILSGSTQISYKRNINDIKAWFDTYNIKRMDQINSAFVGTFNQYTLIERKLKKSYAKNIQKVFIRFLKWAIQNNYYNNYQLVLNINKIPKTKRGAPRYFSTEELSKIFKYSDYSAAFQFLFYTGLRVSELCKLTWFDVKEDSKILTLSKTKALNDGMATIPLNSKALAILASLPKTSGPIFTTTKNEPITQGALWKALKKILEKEDIPDGTIHTFRHSFASHLSIKGVSIHKIKELLRHSDIKMTMIYAHLNNQAIVDASEEIPEIGTEDDKNNNDVDNSDNDDCQAIV